jgi:hypothetical protein
MKFLEKLFSKRQRSQYDGENTVLVQAMHELALKNDSENAKKMYEVLLSSTLLIPTPELPASRPGEEPDNHTTLALTFITDDQGSKLTPAFTDIEALRNWDPNTPCLSAHARGFFEVISHYYSDIEGVVLNPFDPIRKMIRPTGRITRGEFEVLARGLVPRPEAGGLVSCALPAASLGGSIRSPNQTLPPAIAELLCESAKAVSEITVLYVFSLVDAKGRPRLTVGVGLDRKVEKRREQLIVQTLWQAVGPKLTDELKALDFMVMTGRIAAQVETAGRRIYQRL